MCRFLKYSLRTALVLIGFALAAGAALWIYYTPDYRQSLGLVYGTRDHKELTMDVFTPKKQNGAGIIVLISGRWKSKAHRVSPWPVAPLLRRGYTLFFVRHLSQPGTSVMDTVVDVKRAVRFIRHNADSFEINPHAIGVSGGSSGGHLALMIATTPDDGAPLGDDPVERTSCKVQAAAVLFPPTDLVNLGDSTQNLHDGGPPKSFVRAFGMQSRAAAPWLPVAHAMSPIDHINASLPPILIYHGTADTLVPFDQSTRFQAKALAMGIDRVSVVPRKGKSHGWPGMLLDVFGIARFYDQTLLAHTPPKGP